MPHELGNALFAVVEQVQPELAPKLTGMLLQLGENECWACLEDHEKLAVRLDEAMAILDGAQPKQEAPRAKAAHAERRVDPEDGISRTFAELQKHYAGQYSLAELKEYWEHCKSAAAAPANGTAAPKKAAAKEPAPKPVAKAPSTPAPAPKPAAAKPTPKPAAPKAAAPAPVLAPRKPAKESIPGLWAFLSELKLEAYFAAVEKWADEQGAVSLEELVEFKDDLAKDLNLRTLEKKRMDNAEAAAKVAEQMPLGEGPPEEQPDPPEEEEEDQDAEEDDLAEGRYAQLDTERDLAMMSRGFDAPVEVEEPPPPRTASHGSRPSVGRPPNPRPEPAAKPPAAPVPRSGTGSGAAGYSEPANEAREERRVDLEDGVARTYKEFQAMYTHLYSPPEIREYWNECRPEGDAPAPAPAPAVPTQRAAPAPAKAVVKAPKAPGQPWGSGTTKVRF